MLGEMLLGRGLISASDLAQALARQEKSGARLGDIVVAMGMVGYLPLYRTLAEHTELPFIDLLQEPPDTSLLKSADAQKYIRERSIPWRKKDGHIIYATTELPLNKTHHVITSPLDIRRSVERLFGTALEEKCRLALWKHNPALSARTTLSRRARLWLYAALFVIFALAYFFPNTSVIFLIAFCCISYCTTLLIKTLMFTEGTRPTPPPDWDTLLAALEESSLPIYTILVPMVKEAASLPGMLAALRALDYPQEKLDIKLVLEADDFETLNAALALKPNHHFEIIRVPTSSLRTKPRACNYALNFARGEYVTIYDADDRPEPLQLKKAVAFFRISDPSIICLQARLNYYNAHDNWLTRFFAFEYAILFEVLLHGLERLNIPLPLGGTSNHISLTHLRELGEWDPFNVTEDADLGIRIAAHGFRTAMLDSLTLEEAPLEFLPWIRQRSRWIKGYMQTWLVHMRSPRALYHGLGARSFFGFQFFMGFSSFTFLTGPLVWLLSVIWYFFPGEHTIPVWLLFLTVVNLLLNITTHWYMTFGLLGRLINPTLQNRLAAGLYPLYLFLHSVASYKALWQLIVKPHFWEKTTHGLARQFMPAEPQESPLTAAA